MINSIQASRSQHEEDEYLQYSDESPPESLPSDASENAIYIYNIRTEFIGRTVCCTEEEFQSSRPKI